MKEHTNAVEVNKGKQIVKYYESYGYHDEHVFTADMIKDIVGEERFIISPSWGDERNFTIDVLKTRLETDSEQERRIEKEKARMEEYKKQNGI